MQTTRFTYALNCKQFPRQHIPPHMTKRAHLPEIIGILPISSSGLKPTVLQTLEQRLASGLPMIQIRCAPKTCLSSVKQCINLCRQYKSLVVFNGEVPSASMLALGKLDGIHLKSREMLFYRSRPVSSRLLLSVACHNVPELEHARRLQVDLILLSPVLKTNSHPNATPLGWAKFSEMVKAFSTPIYALGGMQPNMLKIAKENAAQGIAMCSALW